MVVAVAGGEQMQISLSVYWMFRERGVNCTEPQADTVGNIDGEALIPLDNSGKTALDYALESGNKKLIHLFRVVLAEHSIPSD